MPLALSIRQQNGSSQTPPHFEYWNRLLVSREELLAAVAILWHVTTNTFFAKVKRRRRKRVKRLPRVQKRDAVTTGKAVRNTNVTSVICFLGVQNRTKIEPRKRLIIEIREIFVRGLRAAFPPRVCRSLNRESVPYINSFSGAAFPPSAAAPRNCRRKRPMQFLTPRFPIFHPQMHAAACATGVCIQLCHAHRT